MYLIFDTETTGLPNNWKAPLTDFDNWPRLVQLAWQLHDIKGNLIEKNNLIIKPSIFNKNNIILSSTSSPRASEH